MSCFKDIEYYDVPEQRLWYIWYWCGFCDAVVIAEANWDDE